MTRSRGKVEVTTRVTLDTPVDLAEHYTPGVADQAKRVADDPCPTGPPCSASVIRAPPPPCR
jgi:malic enzyme